MMNSMRAKMTFFLALSIALFVLILSAIYLFYTRSTQERNFAASLDRAALDSTKLARQGANLERLKAQLEEHNNQVAQGGAIFEGVEAWVVDAQGKEVWHLGPPRGRGRRGGRRPDGERPDDRRPPRDDRGIPQRGPDNHPVDHPIPPLDDPQHWRTRRITWGKENLVLALPWYRVQHDLNSQTMALGILSLLISGAAAFGAWILVGKTLRPIDALAEQAQQASHHPLQLVERRLPLQPTSSDSEMKNLVATLNQMLDAVSEAALSKERFHTSASHELRTPLQALGGHLGVTLSRDRSASEYKEALQEAAQQTARLSKLTGDLLLLNRLQTAATTPQKELVDVTEVGDIALQRAQKTIEARALHVVEKWEALEIEASPSHVEILLGNLVENAAKYAREGGQIGVEIEAANRSVRVWNECDEAQFQNLKTELPRLFEAFYRPDSARSSETGGNGLGLAICQTLAEANGWKLALEASNQRFIASITFSS